MRDPLGLSTSSFNNLNSYNSSKNFLLNVQTSLRDLHIENLKVGKQKNLVAAGTSFDQEE